MPKENNRAGEVKKTGEIGSASFITRDESPRVLKPGEEPFDLPAALVAAKRTAILGEVDAIAAMRGDEFDSAVGEGLIEAVAVVGGVPDEPLGIVGEEAGVYGLLDELRFVRRRRGDCNGERKTSAVCNGHDLGPLAALGFANVAPFFLGSSSI